MFPRFLTAMALVGILGCQNASVGNDPANLHWLGLRSHADIDTSNRFRFSPRLRMVVHEVAPARDPQWGVSAQEGVSSVFQPPVDGAGELTLRISWPEHEVVDDRRWSLRLLPRSADVAVTFSLIDSSTGQVVQTGTLKVDPHWFSPGGARPGEIRGAFARFAATLAGTG